MLLIHLIVKPEDDMINLTVFVGRRRLMNELSSYWDIVSLNFNAMGYEFTHWNYNNNFQLIVDRLCKIKLQKFANKCLVNISFTWKVCNLWNFFLH